MLTARREKLPSAIPALADVQRGGEPTSDLRPCVNLDRNERLEPLPEWFLESIRESIDSALFTRYPIPDELRRMLAAHLALQEAQVLLTSGSDAAIKALYHAYIRPGDAVVMLDPSYAMFEVYARLFQARAVPVPFTPACQLDPQLLFDSVVPGVRLVMLANPNQPTGTLLEEAQLRRLAERTEAVGSLLAVDEAYFPFSRTTVLPWVNQFPHLVVIRTFSKAAGLAGLRLGFVAGNPAILVNLSKVRSAHDVNSMSLLCATHLLQHPEVIDDYAAQVEAGRRFLTERVRALGLTPLPSATNFMLIRVAPRCEPAELVARFRRRNYLVKGPFSAACLLGCIRITLGPEKLMKEFAEVLAELVNGEAHPR